MFPLISIIVPIYNGQQHIESCVHSLLAQESHNFEVILVDDGSDDNSSEICDSYAKRYQFITVIHQKNRGLSAARNAGIMTAQGRYVLFVDVDDVISDKTVAEIGGMAEATNADLVLFGFWYYKVKENILIGNEIDENYVGKKDEFFYDMLIAMIDNEFFNAPWNKLIKRSILMENNLWFDETCHVFEDIIFAPQLFSYCEKIAVSSGKYYKYFLRSSGNILSGFYPDCFESLEKFYNESKIYCEDFNNNRPQCIRIQQLFIDKSIAFVKKLCCTNKITVREKLVILNNISNSLNFLAAMEQIKLPIRRRLVCNMLKKKHIKLCYCIYKVRFLLY